MRYSHLLRAYRFSRNPSDLSLPYMKSGPQKWTLLSVFTKGIVSHLMQSFSKIYFCQGICHSVQSYNSWSLMENIHWVPGSDRHRLKFPAYLWIAVWALPPEAWRPSVWVTAQKAAVKKMWDEQDGRRTPLACSVFFVLSIPFLPRLDFPKHCHFGVHGNISVWATLSSTPVVVKTEPVHLWSGGILYVSSYAFPACNAEVTPTFPECVRLKVKYKKQQVGHGEGYSQTPAVIGTAKRWPYILSCAWRTRWLRLSLSSIEK